MIDYSIEFIFDLLGDKYIKESIFVVESRRIKLTHILCSNIYYTKEYRNNSTLRNLETK